MSILHQELYHSSAEAVVEAGAAERANLWVDQNQRVMVRLDQRYSRFAVAFGRARPAAEQG